MRRIVVGTSLFAIACQLIAGLEDRDVAKEAGAGDAGQDVGAGEDPCTMVGLPSRPDPSTSSADDSTTILYALRAIDFGFDAGATGPYGFNLDKACTCPGPDTCTRPPDAGTTCDVPKGIDNNGNALFRKAADLNLVTQAQLNMALSTGESGVLVRIEKYNGGANDAQVRVAVFSSLGLQGFMEGGVPKHDGNDSWTVDTESVLGGTTTDGGVVAVHVDQTAYVANNTVVAALDFPVTIGSTITSAVTIELTSGFIVAKLGQMGGVPTLSGTFAGRWPMTKMLTSFQAFVDPFNPPQHLCGTDGVYQIVKGLACNTADIARAPDLDNRGPCDAVGVGVHFDAIQSQFGKVSTRPDAGFPCGPQWSDSCQ